MLNKIRSIALYAISATVLFFCLLFIFQHTAGQSQDYYLIKKGNHYPNKRSIAMHTGVSSMERTVSFDSGCIYKFGTDDDGDINKTFGWGVGLTNKHSIRVGWNCKSDSGIDLYAYIHYNGKRWIIPKDSSSNPKRADLIGKGFLPNYTITLRISRARDAITFEAIQLNRKERLVIKFRNFPDGTGWYMYPYFGGTMTAPHDMVIILQ